MSIKTKLSGWRANWTTSKTIAVAAALVVVGGGFFAVTSRASSYFASVTPTGGTVSGNAQIVSASGAIGGKAVQFGAGAPVTPPPVSGGKYVSIAAYPGWIQNSITPDKLDYSPWTAIDDFGLWPSSTGEVATADMENLSYIAPAVSAAHKANKQILMCFGGEGAGPAFVAAAQPQYRTKLINNIVAAVKQYGFDGVDIDWEESVPANQANYIALVKELSTALNQAFPSNHKNLSIDVDNDQIPPSIATQLASSVDTVNIMSYWDDGLADFNGYVQAGVPANKLLIGLGVSSGYADSTAAKVAAKVDLVKSKGAKGTFLWQIGDLNTYKTDPRLDPLRQMVSIK